MKKSALALLAFLAIGCQPSSPDANAAPAAPPKDGAASAPAKTESPNSGSVAPKPVPDQKATETAKAPQSHPGDISNRLFQLRDLSTVSIKLPRATVSLWVMNSESKEAEGMMWLTEKDVKPDQGMIFVFGDESPRSFWMQNTLIPLDIIYITAKGKVLNIAGGKPRDETSLPSSGPAQYVIELKQGQAAKFGVQPGTILDIPKSLKAEG